MLQRFEDKMGLPKLKELSSILAGDSGKRLEMIFGSLEKLVKTDENIATLLELLNTIERLDKSGALERLNALTDDLVTLSKNKNLKPILDAVVRLEPTIRELVGSKT